MLHIARHKITIVVLFLCPHSDFKEHGIILIREIFIDL